MQEYASQFAVAVEPEPAPAPAPEPAAAGLDETERGRMIAFVDKLDTEIAANDELAASPVGIGLAALVSAARGDPDGTYSQMQSIYAWLGRVERWIRRGVPIDAE